MRILEVGDQAYLKSIKPESVDYFYVGKKTTGRRPFLTWRVFFRLRGLLCRGHYQLVVLSIFGLPGPAWRRNRNLFSNLLKFGRGFLLFYVFGVQLIPWLLRRLDIPFIVLDRKDDPDKIPAHFFPALARCQAYYWREQPIKLENGFLFTTSYLEDTSAVRKSPFYLANRHKIKPISLGIAWRDIYDRLDGGTKTIDVFFAGTLKHVQVRLEGLPLIEELQAEGLRVVCSGEKPYSLEEYLDLCAKSWLVWSPEGHGWDCYRHYEICLAHSIPVLNYPRIRRYRPLVEGRHAFYYGPEDDHLKTVIMSALALPQEDLRQISSRAREHVCRYHLDERIFAHVTAHACAG